MRQGKSPFKGSYNTVSSLLAHVASFELPTRCCQLDLNRPHMCFYALKYIDLASLACIVTYVAHVTSFELPTRSIYVTPYKT